MPRMILREKGLKSIARRHPWIFSGAVAKVEGKPEPGETVEVVSPSGAPLALAAYSPESQIVGRVWEFLTPLSSSAAGIRNPVIRTPEGAEFPNREFLTKRVADAVTLRRRMGLLSGPESSKKKSALQATAANTPFNGACRVVNSESDGLPGLVADLYGPWLVCQFLSAGAERHKTALTSALASAFNSLEMTSARNSAQPSHPSTVIDEFMNSGLSGIYERSDTDVRTKEGMKPFTGPLLGLAPPDTIEIAEDGRRYLVDIKNGHKTGFYLDQRVNRSIVQSMSRECRVLNCFSYTGGFGIAAMAGGATSITSVDTSAPSLDIARAATELNANSHSWSTLDTAAAAPSGENQVVGSCDLEWICGDAFKVLREFAAGERRFDLVVLDPPKFASSAAQLTRACRGYKDINRLAFSLLEPGGILVTFSCSGLLGSDLFGKVVADAALDAGKEAVITNRLCQAPDHAVGLPFPEGQYLKGLVCRVVRVW